VARARPGRPGWPAARLWSRTAERPGRRRILVVGDQTRRGEIRITTAMLRLAQDDPHAATAALAPVLDGSAPMVWPTRLTQAFLPAASGGHARRRGRCRAGPGARAGPGRARRRAVVVPAAPGALPARAPRSATYRPRCPDRGDPEPARRKQVRAAARRAAAAASAAERQRTARAALPADQPVGAADRQRTVRLAQHRQDPHAPPVRQARHASSEPTPSRAPATCACWHPPPGADAPWPGCRPAVRVRPDRLHGPVPARQRAGILRPLPALPLASSPHGPWRRRSDQR